jgi:lipopolysaccharide biosynthesis regulator YciM
MFEIAIMLLPVAAASGWYLAAKHYKTKLKKPTIEHADYFKGLNYLLNEQPDKAIDVFVNLLDVDDETIEIHLALGTMFRQRGEVEKSIRLHQNLIARPQLSQHIRVDVLNELGMDYMRAGLLDRAESIFLELEKNSLYKAGAIKQLFLIFQQEKEWLKAIDYAIKLELIKNEKQPVLLSHLHCEMAQLSHYNHDNNAAKIYLKKALKIDSLCVRANVLIAQMAIDNDEHKLALKTLMKLSGQDERFVPVYLDLIIDCFDTLKKPKQKFSFLAELQSDSQSTIVFKYFIDVLIDQKGIEQALDFMREKLLNEPKESYLKLYADIKTIENIDSEAKFLRDIINKFDDVPLSFKCTQCGFDSIELNWNCPSCKQWGVTIPILL